MNPTCKICYRKVPNKEDEFCCPGCAAVYEIVNQLELEGAAKDERIKMLLEGVFPSGKDVNNCIKKIDNPEESSFNILGMVCPACAWLIHNRLSKLDGISDLNINFISELCEVSFDPKKLGNDDIYNSIRELGYEIQKSLSDDKLVDMFRFGAGWFFALNCMMISFVVYSSESWLVPTLIKWICSFQLLLFGTLVPFYAAKKTLRVGFKQIISRSFRMESLVVLSTLSAWLYSIIALINGDFQKLYFDVVALLLMLIETGNLITHSFYKKLYKRVYSLTTQLPKKIRTDNNNFVSIDSLKPGLEFFVKRNELIPTDGILLNNAEFDLSLISGESSGLWIEKGQFIGAGSKLLSEKAVLVVPPSGQSNLLEKIVENTINAFNSKKDKITTGDKISQYFVPSVLGIGIIILIFNLLNGYYQDGFYRLLSILIVACPCAFGIAEPLVLTAAVDKMRKYGIQFLNGSVLSLKPNYIIFDKTGTLTEGKPSINNLVWLVEEKKELLDILASIESGIDHPVAKACTSLGNIKSVENRIISDYEISAEYNGKRYRAGSAKIFPMINIPHELKDKTIVLFGDENKCFLIIGLEDNIKEECYSVIESLSFLNAKSLIFSGDRQEVATKIGSHLKINESFGLMTSDQKRSEIQKIQENGNTVLMVGDGINDSQALAAADIGLSVYTAEASAKMSSDGVFLQPNINSLKTFPKIITMVRKKIFFNYVWAFLYNIIGIFLASVGWLSPKYCAVGMVFSNFVVIYNSSIWPKIKNF